MVSEAGMVVSLGSRFTKLVEEGRSSGRLWLYSNYHCNLACRYCLTASSPLSPVRGLTKTQMTDAVSQAKDLGFTSVFGGSSDLTVH